MRPVVILTDPLSHLDSPAVREPASCSRSLCGGTEAGIQVLVPWTRHSPAPDHVRVHPDVRVTILELPDPEIMLSEALIRFLPEFLDPVNPALLLVPNSPMGLEVAGALAVRYEVGSITNVNGIETAAVPPLFYRPVCNGQYAAAVSPDGRPAIVSLMPGSFQCDDRIGETWQRVEKIRYRMASPCLKLIETRRSRHGNSALSNARVILSAGRGIGSRQVLARLFDLSRLIPGSAVGASRPLVDAGWIGYPHQVGITGATVAPDVYIAFGISGSSQHLAGMNRSGHIIAVTNDPAAAITRHADRVIIGDAAQLIDQLIDQISTSKKTGKNCASAPHPGLG